MTETQTLAYILGGGIFVMALVILGLSMTILEMKQRLNVLWRDKMMSINLRDAIERERAA
jgi:hypothetical protein